MPYPRKHVWKPPVKCVLEYNIYIHEAYAGQTTYPDLTTFVRADLCGIAHVAKWEMYDLHDLAHASRVDSVVQVPRYIEKQTRILQFWDRRFCRNSYLRVLLSVCPHGGCRSATPLGTTACSFTRVNRVMKISLCAEPVFEGDNVWQLWKEMDQFIKCIL